MGKLFKLDRNSDKLSKRLICWVCVEVDISKPLKVKIKCMHDGIFYECLLGYENITDICFDCGSQSHRLNSCVLNSKSIAFKVEKL